MKKLLPWLQRGAVAVLFIAMAFIGVRLLDGNYDFTAAAYLALVCWVVFCVCLLIRAFTDRCPHCGKLRTSRGDYCPFCGKKLSR